MYEATQSRTTRDGRVLVCTASPHMWDQSWQILSLLALLALGSGEYLGCLDVSTWSVLSSPCASCFVTWIGIIRRAHIPLCTTMAALRRGAFCPRLIKFDRSFCFFSHVASGHTARLHETCPARSHRGTIETARILFA